MTTRMAFVATGLGLSAACANQAPPPKSSPSSAASAPGTTAMPTPNRLSPQSLIELAQASGNFNTLLTALRVSGLDQTLAHNGPFTLFAPTDEAFGKLDPNTIASLMSEPERLRTILTYHVIAGKIMSDDVANLSVAQTIHGSDLPVDARSGMRIGQARVVEHDLQADNGVIHAIDTVLIPE